MLAAGGALGDTLNDDSEKDAAGVEDAVVVVAVVVTVENSGADGFENDNEADEAGAADEAAALLNLKAGWEAEDVDEAVALLNPKAG